MVGQLPRPFAFAGGASQEHAPITVATVPLAKRHAIPALRSDGAA